MIHSKTQPFQIVADQLKFIPSSHQIKERVFSVLLDYLKAASRTEKTFENICICLNVKSKLKNKKHKYVLFSVSFLCVGSFKKNSSIRSAQCIYHEGSPHLILIFSIHDLVQIFSRSLN